MPRATTAAKHPAAGPVQTKPYSRPAKTEIANAAKMLHLIEAAEDTFRAKGYHTATMNDVAKAAGMSKKTVYQLIESKTGLFVSLFEHHQEKLRFPVVQQDWQVDEILFQYLFCLAQFLLSMPQISLIRLIMAEYTHGKDFGRVFHQKHVTKSKLALESCLAHIGPPRYRRISDVKEMAAMLFGMALGELHLGVLIGFRPMPTKAILARRIRLAVEVFLKGCEAEAAAEGATF